MWMKLINWFGPFLFCTLILLSGFSSPVHATDIYVLTSDSSKTTQQITADIQKKIPSIKLITDISTNTKNKDAVYITIGPSALQARLLQSQIDGVTISVFTSSQVYHSILETIPASHKKDVTAIYADPSPLNQLRLITLLYKKPTNVAVILSDKTIFLEKNLFNAANQTNTNLTIEKFSDGETINRVLNSISTVPVILATPDNNVFSQENIRNILLTSYRRNQAVIGFSPSLVKAGALATTYSDIDDVNTQLAEIITSYISTEKLPAPQFPSYFKTVVNENVAHSMDMIVSDDVLLFSHQPRRKQP